MMQIVGLDSEKRKRKKNMMMMIKQLDLITLNSSVGV
jgi:hypothetical protein